MVWIESERNIRLNSSSQSHVSSWVTLGSREEETELQRCVSLSQVWWQMSLQREIDIFTFLFHSCFVSCLFSFPFHGFRSRDRRRCIHFKSSRHFSYTDREKSITFFQKTKMKNLGQRVFRGRVYNTRLYFSKGFRKRLNERWTSFSLISLSKLSLLFFSTKTEKDFCFLWFELVFKSIFSVDLDLFSCLVETEWYSCIVFPKVFIEIVKLPS